MNENTSVDNAREPAATPAGSARAIVRAALKASLATLDRASGHPYASLVLVATEPSGAPVLLLSRLALHNQNLAGDPRASLLFDATDGAADPLSGARVTLIGHCAPTDCGTARRRFLARHPSAEMYADFADFSFFALTVERAHLVGGFGRIVGLGAGDLQSDVADAAALVDAEPALLDAINARHATTLARLAARPPADADLAWRACGIDPDGVDLVAGPAGARIAFAERVTSPAAALAALAARA